MPAGTGGVSYGFVPLCLQGNIVMGTMRKVCLYKVFIMHLLQNQIILFSSLLTSKGLIIRYDTSSLNIQNDVLCISN